MIHATIAIWMRHMRKFFRNREELGGLLIQPILWVGLFGIGMARMVNTQTDYVTFMLPGILALTALGGAAGGGMMFLDERLRGILREYQVAPIPRLSILLGHIAATVSKAFFQISIVILVGLAVGVDWSFGIGSFVGALGFLLAFTLGFCGLSLGIAIRSKSIMGYHGMLFLFNLPLLFASNALYPLSEAPIWMQWLAYANPATWYIDATRTLLQGSPSMIPLWGSAVALVVFASVSVGFALRRFRALTTA
jgi:ABC-2 type transport system permease protein